MKSEWPCFVLLSVPLWLAESRRAHQERREAHVRPGLLQAGISDRFNCKKCARHWSHHVPALDSLRMPTMISDGIESARCCPAPASVLTCDTWALLNEHAGTPGAGAESPWEQFGFAGKNQFIRASAKYEIRLGTGEDSAEPRRVTVSAPQVQRAHHGAIKDSRVALATRSRVKKYPTQ
jgi:hypothetical protein